MNLLILLLMSLIMLLLVKLLIYLFMITSISINKGIFKVNYLIKYYKIIEKRIKNG